MATTKTKTRKPRKAAERSVGQEMIDAIQGVVDGLRAGKRLEEFCTVRQVDFDIPITAYGPAEVKALRSRLKISQPILARWLGVEVDTVRAWEQGKNTPSKMACRFLDETAANPGRFRKVLRASFKSTRVGPRT